MANATETNFALENKVLGIAAEVLETTEFTWRYVEPNKYGGFERINSYELAGQLWEWVVGAMQKHTDWPELETDTDVEALCQRALVRLGVCEKSSYAISKSIEVDVSDRYDREVGEHPLTVAKDALSYLRYAVCAEIRAKQKRAKMQILDDLTEEQGIPASSSESTSHIAVPQAPQVSL